MLSEDTLPRGWMRPDCVRWLLAQGCSIKVRGVEVGSYRGRSTTALVQGMPDTAVLYAVDNWCGAPGDPDQQRGYDVPDEVFMDFLTNLASPILFGKVVPMRMTSLDGAAALLEQFGPKSFDFVFIDADHRYEAVRADILAYKPLVRNGGLLCGHDYSTRRWVGVKQAVDELLGPVTVGPGSIWSITLTGEGV